MSFLRYLRDVFIVIGVLLIVSGVFVGWAIVAVCALAFTYVAGAAVRLTSRLWDGRRS